jgi:long-subunit acyl-CoA synthetase (AMP-forming)
LNLLVETLRKRVRSAPDEIVIEGSETQFSAASLLASAGALAAMLESQQVSTIALLANNSPEWVIVDIACQIKDCCIVPVPTFFTQAQVSKLLDNSGAQLLIFEPDQSAIVPVAVADKAQTIDVLPIFRASKLTVKNSPLTPPNTGKITFTSGSTGDPKGVCLSLEQCLRVAGSLADALDTVKPRHLCLLPLSILLENIGGIYMPLLKGGRAVVLPPSELGMRGSSGLDIDSFLNAISKHQPNTLIIVPEFLTVLDAAMEGGWQPPVSLEFVAVGGARVSPELIARVQRRGLPVYEGYGLSESGSVVSLNTPAHNKAGTSGRVLPHVQVGQRKGELQIAGNTFLGYLNQPDTWGRTTLESGDLGTIDADGFLTVAGRKKNVIINSFGRNISPEWVESELSASGLFGQVVVLGDARPTCLALLRTRDTELSDLNIQAAIDLANITLPDYARIGRWLRMSEAMTLENGLLTDNGRPRRQKIYEHFSEQIDLAYSGQQETFSQ